MRDGKAIEEAYVVVVGASAGGIEALVRLVTALPADFPAPVVIAQHADPHVPSHLAEILQRQTKLRVVASEDGDDELQPHTIYLAAAGRNVAIRGSLVTGSNRIRGHPIPSIDGLFISASESYGDRVIAIILTGMGTDGVAGVRAVKERGGTVLVQEPESAAFPALPAAIPLSHIDYTTNLESLAPLLVTLTAGPRDADIANPDVLSAFLNQLRGRTGIDFRQYKTPTLIRRLSRLMATAGCDSLKDYLRHLTAHPEAYQRLISTFLIKVTEFFRDPALFAQLRDSVLPDIINHARTTRSELRLWSAGCATGEEAYSLAIALAELLGDDVETMPIRIFATDLDADAIAFARRGIYPSGAFSEMNPALLSKYFTRIDDAFQIKKRIRNLTVFGEYDLGQRAPFPRIDLVLCRNVLIYFTKELQQRTLQLFAFSLRVGGYLVLGKSETTSPLPQYFAAVKPTLKIFRRQGERLLIPAPALTDDASARERTTPRRVALGSMNAPRRPLAELPAPRWSLVDRLGSFLFESSIGVVVIDRNYDISTINQAARSMLGIHGQGIGEDLVHVAEVPSAELKAALDAAFRNEAGGRVRELEKLNITTNETQYLEVSCYPDRTISKEGRVEGVILLVSDVTKSASWLRRLTAENERNRAEAARLAAQNVELKERQSTVIEANDELTSANAELRSANEHLLISAEEAEAGAEEVETLNEEMQATSEELETLNEELQATVEELNTTNEELAARGNELERAAREREDELHTAKQTLETLGAVVEQIPVLMCLLDPDRKVRVASREYLALAERNGSLPTIGETWKHPRKSIKLADAAGHQRTFAIEQTRLPQDGPDVMFLLRPE
ncbi:MAG: PAS domain-containing protein [Candidatus Eremiobacteraeota bacterium]|nr:PAS domain-containing protein [Candidatus Eremiobacteraeota bacterium]